jgi:hypothetical protein
VYTYAGVLAGLESKVQQTLSALESGALVAGRSPTRVCNRVPTRQNGGSSTNANGM